MGCKAYGPTRRAHHPSTLDGWAATFWRRSFETSLNAPRMCFRGPGNDRLGILLNPSPTFCPVFALVTRISALLPEPALRGCEAVSDHVAL
jgi:hypothetical protein